MVYIRKIADGVYFDLNKLILFLYDKWQTAFGRIRV